MHRPQHPQNQLTIVIPPRDRPSKLGILLKHVCGIDDCFGHDWRKTGMTQTKEALKSIKIIECVNRPFKLHRSCHDLNAGDPQVASHSTTTSLEIVDSPASIVAHRRSSSAMSSMGEACGAVPAANSATISGSDSPRSAALASRAAAVCSSTSIIRFGAFMEERCHWPCRISRRLGIMPGRQA